MGACFCTGQCRETGICPNAWDWQTADRKLSEAEAAIEHLKERLAKVTAERNILAGHLQDIYVHPAANPPIIMMAKYALERFGFAKPPRWAALDH